MRIAIGLLSVLLAVGCGGKKKEDPGTGSGSGAAVTGSNTMGSGTGSAAAGSGSAVEPAGSGTGDGQAFSHKGGNCPSSVFGSTTKAAILDGKVVVTVTADDKDAIVAIQKRAELLLKNTDNPNGAGHDQKGTHGGGIGRCPVFLGEGGTATAKNED